MNQLKIMSIILISTQKCSTQIVSVQIKIASPKKVHELLFSDDLFPCKKTFVFSKCLAEYQSVRFSFNFNLSNIQQMSSSFFMVFSSAPRAIMQTLVNSIYMMKVML